MKRKIIVLTTILASIGVLSSLGHISVEKASAFNSKSLIKVAGAKHDIPYTNTGKIFLQLASDEWKSSSSKIALYFDDTNATWGGFVTPSGNSNYVEYPFNLTSKPKSCKVYRFDSSVQTPTSDLSNPNLLSVTGSIAFDNIIWVGEILSEKVADCFSYSLDFSVKGGDNDYWETNVVDTQLTEVQIDSNDKLEISGVVDIPAGTYFGVNYSNTYTTHSSIASYFEVSPNENIHNSQAGTYLFKVHFDLDDINVSLENFRSYITTPALDAADEFGKEFLSKTSSYCDELISDDVKEELAGKYLLLANTDGAQEAFYNSAVRRGKGIEYTCYASEALSRYVNMQEAKGYTDFLGLGDHNPISSSPLTSFGNRNYSVIVVAILASTVSIAALGTLILLKKKKHSNF